VQITGFPAATWTVLSFSDSNPDDTTDNTVMHLGGTIPTLGQIALAPFDVNVTKTVANVTTVGGVTGGMLSRAAGDWIADGFIVGQTVTINGVIGSWTLQAITNGAQTLVLGDGPALASAASATTTVNTVVRTISAEDVPVTVTLPITIATHAEGGNVTRLVGDWNGDGFVIGQLVMIDGIAGGWRLTDIINGGATLKLRRGLPLPSIAVATVKTVFVPGPHGGLTVVHGGGNMPVSTNFEMTVGANSVTRNDGLAWADYGYAPLFANGQPQHVQVGAAAQTRTISGFGNTVCPYSDPFPGCGFGSVIQFNTGPLELALTPSSAKQGVYVIEPRKAQASAPMNIVVVPAAGATQAASTLLCGSRDFVAAGFKLGMQVVVSGLAGPFTISALTPTSMTLANAALTPTLTGLNAPLGAPVSLTVTGYDPLFAGGFRIGGDTITVGPVAAGSVLAGPNSPLVVYGDTSQDGAWYAGRPDDKLGYEFGPKPFDPFTKIPDSQNEDDEWTFPLGNPYVYGGNDVIDASALFPVACTPSACSLPTVGFTAYGGVGNDYIRGSQTGDHLAGGSGDDEILGLRGVDHIYGDSGVNVNVLTRGLSIDTTNSSPGPTITKAGFINNGTTIEPYPSPVRDNMEAGRDLIFGEGAGTLLDGPQTAYDDVIFADHGAVVQHVRDPNEPDPRLQKIQTTTLASIREIESEAFQDGNDDIVFGNLGRDVIVGGADHDMLDGDEQDDLVFGDQVFLTRRVVETFQTDITAPGNITSGRFQTLCGTLLYSRTDRPDACGGDAPNADTSGKLLVNGTWQNYRDPDSPGIDAFPWWAEYAVEFWDGDPTHHFHDLDSDLGYSGADSFGNDYLAGSEDNDMLFGQLGNDILQGDGGIELAFARMVDDTDVTVHAGASRSPDGCTGATGSQVCDYVGDLDLVGSFEAATDGEDYLEGNGGDDIAFGGLGQDDIVGGSSSFFSLTSGLLRPDGDDILFGGAGTRAGRNDDSTVLPGALAASVHSRDADTLVGDNGNTIRIVGTGGTPLNPTTATSARYLTFVYDNYDNSSGGAYDPNKKLIVRGVSLLDYTAGGPDFNPAKFNVVVGPGCNGSPTSGSCSPPIQRCYTGAGVLGNGADRFGDIGGRDEIHGEAGDDTGYTGCGDDVAYGDAQDDDIVLGWGDDWASGGTGSDGVIGEDGRVMTSRNNTTVGEPLYGVLPVVATDPDTRTSQGNVINEFIYTPGMVQTATINIAGELAKAVDLSPYNLTPAGGADDPLYDPNNADDIVFGGWDDDFLHGHAGDDMLSGAEALIEAYTQLYLGTPCEQEVDCADGLVRSDWTRPYNSGDMLHFGDDTNPWHSNQHVSQRLGEFLLYDEYDPRRTILFNADGSKWRCSAFSNSGHECIASPPPPSAQYFVNFDHSDGRVTALGCVQLAPNGDCLAMATRISDGNDAIFGDLGNDWLMGGTSWNDPTLPSRPKDTLWGGWGNDMLNVDDDLQSGCVTVASNGICQVTGATWLNDFPDTHPAYEDRAYGGAGLDILVGNTGGDRLIDWVGEFNAYLVPFAPFGIATVSRQVEPQLPEFLYALSRSEGADPTRATDDGTSPARNGEPHGEIGLIVQQDHGLWQTQAGGPTDPQAGNIPGGRRDVLRSADFNDGSMSAFAADSGKWTVTGGILSVAADSPAGDAVAVYYHDEYLPIYYELKATVTVVTPTGGWKANSYLIFDYQSPTDFKFAGLDISTNKLVVGRRDASGWQIDGFRPMLLKGDTAYELLVSVNGTAVTVTLGNKSFTHTFAARTIDGQAYGLNKGLLGVGSDSARGTFDDVYIQVVPPDVTLDHQETFSDGVANVFTGGNSGTWSVSNGRYIGLPPAGGIASSLIDMGATISSDSYLEVTTTVRATGRAGLMFDTYSATDYKFVAIDVVAGLVIIGHAARGGVVNDVVVARSLSATTDYTIVLTVKGTTVSVTLNGEFIASFAFNGIGVDGDFGLAVWSGTGSFDSIRIRSNETDFLNPDGTISSGPSPTTISSTPP